MDSKTLKYRIPIEAGNDNRVVEENIVNLVKGGNSSQPVTSADWEKKTFS